MKPINYKLGQDIGDVLRIARAYAKEAMNGSIEPAHLFKALLHKDVGLVKYIEKDLRQDYFYLLEWCDARIREASRSARPMADPEMSEAAVEVFAEADSIRANLGASEVDAKMLLASVVTPGVGFSNDKLKTMPLRPENIVSAPAKPGSASSRGAVNSVSSPVSGGNNRSSLAKFCICLNDIVKSGETDPVIGFDKELSEIFDILGRRTKSNILITGEAGVGKRSLVRAFVNAIVKGEVPGYLADASVYELDTTALGLEVSYKSEIEGRMKKVLDELSAMDNAILVIENLDKVNDRQNMLSCVSGILKSKLNGGLLVICTSSIDGYTKNIETDKELVGKFERLSLEEPSLEYAAHILESIIGRYEDFHGIKVAPEVPATAVRLAKRYFSEKNLPDSAIDMIDRTMALIKSTNDMAARDVEAFSGRFKGIVESDESDEGKAKSLFWLHHELTNRISPIVTGNVEIKDFSTLGTLEAKIEYLKELFGALAGNAEGKIDTMAPSHLLAVVSQKTGIPMGNISSEERDRLVNAEEIMKRRVVGQDHAIRIVLDSVFESRSGLNKKGQPMGSFFFLGPTGTGKTELAKSLADFLFQDETAILRFDMSEYKEEHSVALLYGAPPGYVGYEEGGLLVNQIRQKPYSVVLFDEIEKAHRSVFDLFLQILDEGKLHDRLGRVGDFSNALILFTSNIGSQYIFDSFAKGVVPTHNDMLEVMQGHFRPEFLARLTEIVPFSPITEEIVLMIFNIHLKGLLKTLAEQNISLDVTDEARHQIAMRGFNAQYGARPILGIIRKEIRRPLSKMIIGGKVNPGDKVTLGVNAAGEIEWKID